MSDLLDEFSKHFALILLPTYSLISLQKYLLKSYSFKLIKKNPKKQKKTKNSVNIAWFWILYLFLAAPLP